MFIIEILMLSFSHYFIMLLILLGYFGYLYFQNIKIDNLGKCLVLIFWFYIFGVWTMTGIKPLSNFAPTLIAIPFLEFRQQWLEMCLNVFLFIPLGLFLPMMYPYYAKEIRVIKVGLLLSLSIEMLQMFGMGITDINDLISNTVGAYLGFKLYKCLIKCFKDETLKKLHIMSMTSRLEFVILLVISIVIMLVLH
ncbi:MAG: VanZ family protein [Erysipelotrichaceae bacterium]|nr:VanZ family protein [Erysipelotrichaceae bacterium]MDY5252035.1 VanZ family protein [Erysipelotrichaceae bacterium]